MRSRNVITRIPTPEKASIHCCGLEVMPSSQAIQTRPHDAAVTRMPRATCRVISEKITSSNQPRTPRPTQMAVVGSLMSDPGIHAGISLAISSAPSNSASMSSPDSSS